jgi:hypothetical protein
MAYMVFIDIKAAAGRHSPPTAITNTALSAAAHAPVWAAHAPAWADHFRCPCVLGVSQACPSKPLSRAGPGQAAALPAKNSPPRGDRTLQDARGPPITYSAAYCATLAMALIRSRLPRPGSCSFVRLFALALRLQYSLDLL